MSTRDQLVIEGFFDSATWTVSYLVMDRDTRQCALVDSVLDFDPKSGRTDTASADRLIARVQELGAHVHFARTICRRAEREVIALQESGECVPLLVIQYLNRLADALFVLARYLNHSLGIHEDPWT